MGKGGSQSSGTAKRSPWSSQIPEIRDNRDFNHYYKANINFSPEGCVSQENFKYEEKELI